MIYLDENTIINGGGRQLNFPGAPDLAYHDSFVTANGNPCIYAFMAYLPVNEVTWVASHEFAEAVTDPLYTAWTPDHAQHEIGDYCEGTNATITVSGRTWTVQTIWSDTNNACIAPPAAPIPALHPGPSCSGGGAGRSPGVARSAFDASQIASVERVLPLPPIQFDVQSGTHAINPAAVNSFVKRLFHPLHHSDVVSDLPQFLRTAAELLEQSIGPATPPAGEPAGARPPGVARRG